MISFYAGIGSRKTPRVIIEKIQYIAQVLADHGWGVRSGGARGADEVFDEFAGFRNGKREVWLPWRGYNGIHVLNYPYKTPDRGESRTYCRIAQDHHPAWERCNQERPRASHPERRNHIGYLGSRGTCNNKSRAVICWTPNGKVVGGTGMGIRIAKTYEIPVFNLYDHSTDKVLAAMRRLRVERQEK